MRTLRNSPTFLTITVLALALGIGANLAILAVVNAVLLGIVTMAACFIPARRATRVSPMEVLK